MTENLGIIIPEQDPNLSPDSTESRKVCGIVMPIAAMPDEYSLEHWRRVRKVHERAIGRAGLFPQLVWENAEVDVIQSKILQNIYENDVIVCDVSGLNPNVMLETGLRLSTRRPTIIVTDKLKSPPFDIGTIGYIEYQRDLEYNAIEDFIERLAKKIRQVIDASDKGSYVSFVENYRFETVKPSSVTVTSEEFLRERVDELSAIARRLERGTGEGNAPRRVRVLKTTEEGNPYIRVFGRMTEEAAKKVEEELDHLEDFYVSRVIQTGMTEFLFVIRPLDNVRFSRREALAIVEGIVARGETEFTDKED